jgi:hypothetical protein
MSIGQQLVMSIGVSSNPQKDAEEWHS